MEKQRSWSLKQSVAIDLEEPASRFPDARAVFDEEREKSGRPVEVSGLYSLGLVVWKATETKEERKESEVSLSGAVGTVEGREGVFARGFATSKE